MISFFQIGAESRAPAEVTVDGREICMLNKGEWLEVGSYLIFSFKAFKGKKKSNYLFIKLNPE